MAVKIKVGADLSPAQAAVDDFQQKAGAAGKKAGDSLASGVEAGASKAKGALGGVSTAAEKTAKATESIGKQLSMEKAVAGLGALRGILNDVGVSLLGMTEAEVKAAGGILDMAQKGAQFGAVLGPWGMAAGAAIGVVAGFFADAAAKAAATTKEVKTLKEGAQAAREQFSQFGKLDFGGLLGSLKSLEQKQKDLKKAWDESLAAEVHWYSFTVTDFAGKAAIIAAAQKETEKTSKLTGEALIANMTAVSKAGDDAIVKSAETMSKLPETLKSATAGWNEASFNITKIQGQIDAAKKEVARSIADGGEGIEANAKSLAFYNNRLTELQKEMTEATASADSYASSIHDLTQKSDKATTSTKALGDAIQDSIVVTVAAVGAAQKDQLLNISFYFNDAQAKIVAASKKAKDELDGLLGSGTEASTKGATDKFFADLDKEAQARVDKNPIEVPLLILPAPGRMSVFKAGMDQLKDQATEAGAAIAQALGGQAVAGINAMFDAWANGTKRSADDRKRARAEFERATGSMLMTDAVGHIVAGGVKALVPLTSAIGLAELAGGLAEFAIGAAMGGVGAAGQKRLGGTAGAASSGGAAGAPSGPTPPAFGGPAQSGGTATTQELPGVNYWLTGTVVFPTDPRGMAQLGRFMQTANTAANQGGFPKLNR